MERLAAQVPDDVPVETLITDGPLAIGVARLAEQLPADLVLLGCHGCTSEEHASLTEDLLGRCNCPLLTMNEGEERTWSLHLDRRGDRLLRFLVPTDFSPASAEAVRYAFDLARQIPAEVHLLHVVTGSAAPVAPIDAVGPAVPYREAATADAQERLEDLIPADLDPRVHRHVKSGRADEVILELAGEVGPDLIVMGEHARELLRRFLTRDTARSVLHSATCPVWFVPPPVMAA
jgi:nucleotide-binding universal stress UspA family protein